MRVVSKVRIRLRGGIALEKGENVVAEPVTPEVQRALEKLRKGRVLTFEEDPTPAPPAAESASTPSTPDSESGAPAGSAEPSTTASVSEEIAAVDIASNDGVVSREDTMPLDLAPERAAAPAETAAAEPAKPKTTPKASRRRSE